MTDESHFKMRKYQLAEHISDPHAPGHQGHVAYPSVNGLIKWHKEELERRHRELHERAITF